jgi:hypothetical protein
MLNSKLTRKAICKITGATINQIAYLRDLKVLPVVQQSAGPGFPVIYSEEAIDVVKQHIQKGSQASKAGEK